MTAITRDEIYDRADPNLAAYSLFSPGNASTFNLLAIDPDGRGGYAKGRVGKHLVRFDVTGRSRTRNDGWAVRVTPLVDTGDRAGTLTPTGKPWTGHQVPVAAVELAMGRSAEPANSATLF